MIFFLGIFPAGEIERKKNGESNLPVKICQKVSLNKMLDGISTQYPP
jgi:hypothetical protein